VDAFQAIVLGIVQGLTEFLPISSTAHLRIIPSFLGWEDPGAAFTAVVQLGTMAAVVLHFWSDLWRIARAWLRSLTDRSARDDLDARMGWYIGLGTIPIAIIGFVFRDQIEDEGRSLALIGIALIIGGLVLSLAEMVSKRNRAIPDLNARDAAVIGSAQALALIPGVSRSGATIGAGLFVNFDRVSAARYSFLLSVPAVVLSGLFEMRDIGDPGGASFWPTLIATIAAFVAGYWSISFLLRYLGHASLRIFIVYRFVLGALVLVLAATNAIN
jgi:undecaprenyl-diphosphatase